jgi:hypothetical protein
MPVEPTVSIGQWCGPWEGGSLFYHHHHHHHHWHDSPLWALAFLGFLNNLIFMGWGQPHAQPPTWRTSVSLFIWLLPLDLSGLGDPTSSYATTIIALRVSGGLKPHHHNKVWLASMGVSLFRLVNMWSLLKIKRLSLCAQSSYLLESSSVTSWPDLVSTESPV